MEAKQFREILEWAGFRKSGDPLYTRYYLHADGSRFIGPPVQTMNTLFKWFWPKLTERQREDVLNDNYFVLINDGDSEYICEEMLKTIYKVIKGEPDVENR